MNNDPNSYPEQPEVINPYAPGGVQQNDSTLTEAEAYRKKYINHEASCKSVGLLYALGGIFLLLIGGFALLTVIFAARASGQGNAGDVAAIVVGALFFIGLGIFDLVIARGLRRLEPWSRIATMVLSAFGLLAFPVGTLVSAYILYLMACEKGHVVFSDAYKQIIDETPHIKYQTSSYVVVLFVVLLVVITLIIGIAIFAG